MPTPTGLAGGAQLTAAVRVDGRVCGGIRWYCISTEDVERGIWLAGSTRRCGFGGAVLGLRIDGAATTEARRIVARTRVDNGPALPVQGRAGAAIENGPGPEVSAVIELGP
ncbi:GNAT family N-acetyltransferase [Kocuria arenosa]|uniref:GNAT family N-acetyltransferase n=1 Tax=Kocuria arenosa TaxID=3071446 RepID=UPI0034D7591D